MYGGIGKWSVQEEGARFVFWLLDGRQFTLATSAVSHGNQVYGCLCHPLEMSEEMSMYSCAAVSMLFHVTVLLPRLVF
jgi:hypothetical protein